MSLYNEITFADFQRIPEVEDVLDINSNRFKPGDLFMHGKNVIGQKYIKQPGDIITLYQIDDVIESRCIYFPKFYKIKEENKNA